MTYDLSELAPGDLLTGSLNLFAEDWAHECETGTFLVDQLNTDETIALSRFPGMESYTLDLTNQRLTRADGYLFADLLHTHKHTPGCGKAMVAAIMNGKEPSNVGVRLAQWVIKPAGHAIT